MSKKTSKIAPANDPQNSTSDSITGFVTADKLTDFNPNFNPDYNTKKEVRTQDPKSASGGTKPRTKKEVRTQDPKPASAATKISTKTTKKPRTKKEVRTQDPKPASATTKISTKTTKKPRTKKEVRTRSTLPNPPKRDKGVQEHLETYKISTQQHDIDTAYLSIIALLNDGLRPSEIAVESGVHKNTLQRHLNALKEQGRIFRVGYGVWNVMDVAESTKKRSTHSTYVGFLKPPTPPTSPVSLTQSQLTRFQQDTVRTHAITTRWQIPSNLQNWNNEQRVKFLESHSIPFKPLNIAGGGQRIMVMDRKVHLLNNSILIYDKASYFAATALTAKNTAIAKHLAIIKHVERLLHVEFLIGDDHKFKVSRQHHALIHDHLAHLYNEAGDKLEVRDGKGLWLLIDNSPDENGNGMDELEAVRSASDNRKVQDLLQSVKDTGATMYTVLELNHGLQQLFAGLQQVQATSSVDQAAFASDLRTHVDVQKVTATLQRDTTAVLKQVAAGVLDLTAATNKLTKAVNDESK